MKVEIIALYRVSHLQHCGVTKRVNVTSVYPPLGFVAVCSSSEFCIVFIWLRVVSWEERMGEVINSTVTSVGCIAILLLEFADKVFLGQLHAQTS
jgi:hypothetical protein